MSDFREYTYWTSDDPEVVEAVRERRAERDEWWDRREAFEREYGTTPYMRGGECVGVWGDSDRLPGRWTKFKDSFDPSRPYATNKEGKALLESMSRRAVAVPGVGKLEDVALLDGVAYGRMPTLTDKPGEQWTPCRAWRWTRAMEEGER